MFYLYQRRKLIKFRGKNNMFEFNVTLIAQIFNLAILIGLVVGILVIIRKLFINRNKQLTNIERMAKDVAEIKKHLLHKDDN